MCARRIRGALFRTLGTYSWGIRMSLLSYRNRVEMYDLPTNPRKCVKFKNSRAFVLNENLFKIKSFNLMVCTHLFPFLPSLYLTQGGIRWQTILHDRRVVLHNSNHYFTHLHDIQEHLTFGFSRFSSKQQKMMLTEPMVLSSHGNPMTCIASPPITGPKEYATLTAACWNA